MSRWADSVLVAGVRLPKDREWANIILGTIEPTFIASCDVFCLSAQMKMAELSGLIVSPLVSAGLRRIGVYKRSKKSDLRRTAICSVR
jgi:hypothetical protein